MAERRHEWTDPETGRHFVIVSTGKAMCIREDTDNAPMGRSWSRYAARLAAELDAREERIAELEAELEEERNQNAEALTDLLAKSTQAYQKARARIAELEAELVRHDAGWTAPGHRR